jgi:hypothetical protein
MRTTSPEYRTLMASGVFDPKKGKGYASQIARGVREPSLDLALRIYEATGLRYGKLKDATAKDIATISRVMPKEGAGA